MNLIRRPLRSSTCQDMKSPLSHPAGLGTSLTVRDVAGLLNVSEKTVYRWIGDGKLPRYRAGGHYRFKRAELLSWVTASQVNVSTADFLVTESIEALPPDLHDALQAGGVYYRLSGSDKHSALKSVVEILRLPEEVDRELVLQGLLAREGLGSTAVGDGIAIPHVRGCLMMRIPKPTLTLCFLETPVDFDALDDWPVHALFTLVSPTVKAHLQLLARLTFWLRNPEFKDLITRQESHDEIFQGVRRVSDRLRQRAKPVPEEGVG